MAENDTHYNGTSDISDNDAAAPLPELHLKIEQAITEAAAEAARLSEAEKITQ